MMKWVLILDLGDNIFLFWFCYMFCGMKFESEFYIPVPPHDDDDEFEKWQKEVREAEAEAEAKAETEFIKHDPLAGNDDSDRPSTPPEGEEEFTDDDGTTYKWDRGLRAWVPQVHTRRYLISELYIRKASEGAQTFVHSIDKASSPPK